MPVDDLVSLAQEALLLAVAVSIPVVAAVALSSLVVSVLQAATQVTDSTLTHLPRLLVGALVLAVAGPWMGAQVVAFAARAFSSAS
jgi:flagellar biosynthesis protein FliQ